MLDGMAIQEAEQLVRHDPHFALRKASEVVESRAAEADTRDYQRWLLVKALAHARSGAAEEGARIMREVKYWAEDQQDDALLSLCHRRLSTLFRRVGDSALMLEHAVAAVELLSDDVADSTRADMLLGLGDALGSDGSYEESILLYEEAAALAAGCQDHHLLVAVLNNLAYTQYEAGLCVEAVLTAEGLVDQAAAGGVPLTVHDADTRARVYASVGRYDDAASALEPFCEATRNPYDREGPVMALLTLAEVRRLAGRPDAAQHALDRAFGLAQHHVLSELIVEALREQAHLYAARGSFRDAFETYRDFHLADVARRAMMRDSRSGTLNAIFESTDARLSSDFFRELSGRDPLTGLHNRRHLDARLDELLLEARSGGAVLTIGLVDLDHFKRINDTLTHAIGDEVLRQVANLLQAAVDEEPSGLAVRMGGEEFLILLPGIDHDEGIRKLDRIRQDLAQHLWSSVRTGVEVTASIGVASAPRDEIDRIALIAHADQNLYRAKHAGRDRVVGSVF